MNPAESREKIIVEFRKLYDAPKDPVTQSSRQLEDLLLAKTLVELRALCAQLNISKVSRDGKVNLIVKIRELVFYASQYRTIQGRLDINPDGAGFLSQNSVLNTGWAHQNEQDPYDMYRIAVPAEFLRQFNLKQNDIVGGRRRFPYTTDGESDLVLIEVYEVNHVSIDPEKRSATSADSVPVDSTEPQVVPDNLDDQSLTEDEESSESETQDENVVASGPCLQCEHVRTGLSVARPAFDAVLDVLRTRLQSTYTQKTQEERQASAEFIAERETNQQYSTVDYTRRPTVPRFMYCGLSEFSGKAFCCEVKNLDEKCPDFVPKRALSAPHACKTCQHHRSPASKWVQTVEQIAGSDQKGQPVREMIRQALQSQTETEYQSCVDSVGIITTRPGTLPLCEAYSNDGGSTDPNYIIGPVVNTAERCVRWTPGVNAAREQSLTELAQLVTRAQKAVHERKFPSVLDDNVVAASTERQRVAGNAQADVIEYCLRNLAVDPEFIDSACNQFTLDVWYSQRQAGGGGAATYSGQSSASGGNSEPVAKVPAEPILMTINSRYRHPVYTDMTIMVYQYPPWYVAQVDKTTGKFDLFDLSLFKPGIWTRLNGKKGLLPISLGVQGAPSNQFYLMWLE